MKKALSFVGLLVVAACSDGSTPAGLVSDAAVLASTTMSAKSGVAVCHVTGNGKYNLLNIAGAALPAHLAHGDGVPGQGFTSDCVKAALTITIGTVDWPNGRVPFTVDGVEPSGLTYIVEPPLGGPALAVIPGTNAGSYLGEINSCTSFRIRAVVGAAEIAVSASMTSPPLDVCLGAPGGGGGGGGGPLPPPPAS